MFHTAYSGLLAQPLGSSCAPRLLDRFHLLRFDPVVHFPGAVRIYRSCRRAGVTPRGLIDCMIAAVASGTATPLLAHDRDLARIAEVIDLALDEHSLGS